jgi:hypothetical protein
MTSRWRSSGPRKTLVHDAEVILAEAANGLWVDRAAVDPYQGGNDRGVLPRQVEPVGVEVIEAGVVLGSHDLSLSGA